MRKILSLIASFFIILAQMLRFYTRLPVPKLPFEADAFAMPDFNKNAGFVPLAGVIIGACGAGALICFELMRLEGLVSASLTIAFMVIITGVFHEDGLADVADGFWGGYTVERRLEIMKDSRIGAYGGAALTMALIIRVATLSLALERGPLFAVAGAFIIAAMLSRTLGLMPLTFLPAANFGGLSAKLGQMPRKSFYIAMAVCIALMLILRKIIGFGFIALPIATISAIFAAIIMTLISRRKLQGQTGDVAGATQQVSEIVFMLCIAALI